MAVVLPVFRERTVHTWYKRSIAQIETLSFVDILFEGIGPTDSGGIIIYEVIDTWERAICRPISLLCFAFCQRNNSLL